MPRSDSFSLDRRVALVTGSSRGIGRALAMALGQAGATVVVNGRSGPSLSEAEQDLRACGITAHSRVCDVSSADEVEAMVASIEDHIGPLDIVFNNAGVQQRGSVLEFPPEAFRSLIDTNLVAPFLVSQAAARRMVGRGRGKIVNVCSVMGLVGRATITPYSASKGGLAMLTRGLCAELGPQGIQINGLAPGYIRTDINQELMDDSDFAAWVESRTPAGRWGEVDDLAGTAVFLASAASDFVNGQILYVDGGLTAVV